MADRVAITPGSGDFVLTDQLTDGTLGQGQVQYVKLMDGTIDSSNKMVIDSTGRAYVTLQGIGSVTVPTAPVRPSTSTRTSVNASVTNVTLLAVNTSRKDSSFFNDSASASLYLALGTVAASNTNFTVLLAPGDYFEPSYGYTGQINGIWTAAIGAVRISELT